MTGRTAILHHDDWDGLVSAWVIRSWYWAETRWTLRPVQYGDKVPNDIVGFDTVFVVDFCYSIPALLELAANNRALVIIDHHKTAVDALATWKWPHNATGSLALSHSDGRPIAACELCWEYVWNARGKSVPMPPALVQYAADRDTWTFALPYSKEVSAYAQVVEQTLEACRQLNHFLQLGSVGVGFVAAQGSAVLLSQADAVRRAVDAAEPLRLPLVRDGCTLDGQAIGLATNMPTATLISDTAGQLAEGEVNGHPADFGCCWFRKKNAWVYSLRSRGDFDVCALAKGLGGGGHPNAAGFSSKIAPWALGERSVR